MEEYKFIHKISENEIKQKIKYFFGYEEKIRKYKGMVTLTFSEKEKNSYILEILGISGTILMYGEPGTGKTSLAYEIANEALEEYGIESYKISMSELIESDLGKTTNNMSKAINEIKTLSQEYGAIIILDEIDRVSVDRKNKNEISELKRALLELLDFLDNIRLDHKTLVVGITNYLDLLDPAMIRRFSTVEEIKPSENELVKQIKFLIKELKLKIDLESDLKKNAFFGKYKTCDSIKKMFSNEYLESNLDLKELEKRIKLKLGGE